MRIITILITLAIIFEACNSQVKGHSDPSKTDFVGIWKGADLAEIIFNDNGTFTANYIPVEFGFFPADSFRNIKFDGSGKWILRKGNTQFKELYLDFDKVNLNKNGCAFPLLISGESGILNNKPPWKLFLWKEEEGGEQYVFSKQ